MIKLTSRFGSQPCYIATASIVAVLNWKNGSTTVVVNAGSATNIYVEESVEEVMNLITEWELAMLAENDS